jgi:hypothetical protein
MLGISIVIAATLVTFVTLFGIFNLEKEAYDENYL